MKHDYISTQEELEAFATRARQSPVLGIDTEFLRERTFYPKLCLLQMSTETEIVLVDPFGIADLGILRPLLLDEQVTKVFHAGRQDLEILLNETGVLPTPVFDTQVAASLLGYSQQLGLSALVLSECKVQLDKSDSFTDWSKRPLTDSQLAYAADDVRYLPAMYRKMRSRLCEKGRLEWLAADFAEMSDPANFHEDPRERYRRLKRASHLTRKQLSAAREIAAWREEMAIKRNIPRKWVLTDEQIVEICKRESKTVDDLFAVRGVKEHLCMRDARKVAELSVKGLAAPESTWPDLSTKGKSEKNVDAQLDLMAALVRLRAKENGIALQTLATHDDLVSLARGHGGGQLMKGWRRVLIGNELCKLLEGRISLRINDGALSVENVKE